jgi:hypothetical protein
MAIKILLPIYRYKSSDAEIETLRDFYVELGSSQDISKKDKERLSLEKESRNFTSNLSNQDHFQAIDKYKQQAAREHDSLLQEFNFYNALILNINNYFEQ